MTSLIDKDFWLHVAVCAALIVVFVYFLYFGKDAKRLGYEATEIARCKNIAEAIEATIQESESENELDLFQSEVEQFFIDNYEILGYKQSMKFYNELTLAGINRRKELNKVA